MIESIVFNVIAPKTRHSDLPAKGAVAQPLRIVVDAASDPHHGLMVTAEIVETPGLEQEVRLDSLGNDRYIGWWTPSKIGCATLRVVGWHDQFGDWVDGVNKKLDAGTLEDVDLQVGEELVAGALSKRKQASRGSKLTKRFVTSLAKLRRSGSYGEFVEAVSSADLRAELSQRCYAQRVEHGESVSILVERERAAYGSWYELFPRSVGGFAGVSELLPHIAGLGFDVLYFPPIHPIGIRNRKGRNNSLHAEADDVGSPWAIGSPAGGHDALEGSLGTPEEFQRLVREAKGFGVEVALDLALQCSLDHPWIVDHPSWFFFRPDGSLATAENPPKRYEDIVPINFFPEHESDRVALWEEILRIVRYWISCGVTTFRVDNPHTKPIGFWHWLLTSVRKESPEVVFLAEAFTRPRVMEALAEIGFSQSYTYFTWREGSDELREYVSSLYQPEMVSSFRANLWPNTPDILAGSLRYGPPAAFALRLLLGATMSSLYGIYSGFEFCENQPVTPMSEEYANSEKYELVRRDYQSGGQLDDLIRTVNRARRSHRALQVYGTLEFLPCTNPELLCYRRFDPASHDVVLVAVNLDAAHVQEGEITLGESWISRVGAEAVEVHDCISGEHYLWQTGQNYIRLDPAHAPGHLIEIAGNVV